MIIKHYEAFKTKLESEKLNERNWEVLRTKSEEMAYAIEDSFEAYENNCMRSATYENSAKMIIEILREYKCNHIISLGVGKGILEWHLKKQMPDLFVESTDYAGEAIERLKQVFVEGDAFYKFDMLKGNYEIFDNKAFFIMYRVSEELCYSDWCKVFEKMRDHRIDKILYIPDMLATDELARQLKRRHDKHIERGLQETFCGWIYSEEVLERIFQTGGYRIAERHPMGELILYVLKRMEHPSEGE